MARPAVASTNRKDRHRENRRLPDSPCPTTLRSGDCPLGFLAILVARGFARNGQRMLPVQIPLLRDPHHAARENIHRQAAGIGDRKSTRLNSSHVAISYAVFCLKKKKKKKNKKKTKTQNEHKYT